jgi:hypothetical protein
MNSGKSAMEFSPESLNSIKHTQAGSKESLGQLQSWLALLHSKWSSILGSRP